MEVGGLTFGSLYLKAASTQGKTLSMKNKKDPHGTDHLEGNFPADKYSSE
jgi:hypothetical protein